MRDLFCGWYIKCQNEQGTLAVIPAIHQKGGIQTGSIQLITEEGTFCVPFSSEMLRGSIQRYGFAVGAGDGVPSQCGEYEAQSRRQTSVQ